MQRTRVWLAGWAYEAGVVKLAGLVEELAEAEAVDADAHAEPVRELVLLGRQLAQFAADAGKGESVDKNRH